MIHFKHPANVIETIKGEVIRKVVNGKEVPYPLTFARFFEEMLDTDIRVGANTKARRMADRVMAALEKSKPGGWVSMHEVDYEELVKLIFEEPKSPTGNTGYHPTYARVVGPWVDLVLEPVKGDAPPADPVTAPAPAMDASPANGAPSP